MNQTTSTRNHEIDFRELLKALWDGKLIIFLITTFGTLASVIFALSAQEWWSSNAKITKAQPQDIAAYHQQVKQFQPVFNVFQEDGTVLVSKELDELGDSRVLFQRFVNAFNSTNNKRVFLDGSVEFQQFKSNFFSGSSEITEDSVRSLYSGWFNRITAFIANKGDRTSPYFVNFQTTTKESSFDLLTSYISFTEAQINQDAFNNLQAVINGKRNELVQQKRMLETQAKSQLLVETERTRYALGIARAAGVEHPIQTGNENEIFGIDLGFKGLEAKAKTLELLKNLSVIEPRLQQIEAKLDMLNNLKIDRDVEFQTFRFLESVEKPITRDKPKRALIVLIGIILGGLFGVAIVLMRFLYRKGY
ncbi:MULTISPECIES: LPS O-antigen chain length determinant protein WzzB [unclassified Vibrio]|uniref:LPS O-antigen chain length determinant protein WzzB n=1 Tax=unclassified Vibrio TaxID=2614977 RepID=UPI00352D7C0F